MSNRSWVTLATNDSYGLGALVLAHSLRRTGSIYPATVLITPSVTDAMRERLHAVFAEVVTVDVLDSRDAAHLALLQRPELGITFTKIHCWELTQYEKCVFLDADTLVVQNCDELFEREELSAAPDVGWPDCFNSGVFVYKPSQETFQKLIKFAEERGSFDGGDQGLLNAFFSDWAQKDINKHLPFVYNVTSVAFYSYLPALKYYGQNLKIIHFIGAAKPWLQQFNWESRSVDAPEHLREFLQLWWDLFVGQVHSQLNVSMVEVPEAPPALPPLDVSHHYTPVVDPESEFPWHHPDAQMEVEAQSPVIDLSQFHDPWANYGGQIPSYKEGVVHQTLSGRVEDYEEMKNYVWKYQPPPQEQRPVPSIHHPSPHNYPQEQPHQHFDHSHLESHSQPHHTECHWESQSHHSYGHDQGQENSSNQHTHERHYHPHEYNPHMHEHFQQSQEHHPHEQQCNTQYQPEPYSSQQYQHYEDHSTQHHHHREHENFDQGQAQHSNDHHYTDSPYIHDHQISQSQPGPEANTSYTVSNKQNHEPSITKFISHNTNIIQRIHHVQIHNDEASNHVKHKEDEKTANEIEIMNGENSENECDSHEDIRPRHPYDGFYLRHRAVIDSYGRKICTHEIPPTPTPTPPPEYECEDDPPLTLPEEIPLTNGHDEEQSGVAGNLARVVPGAASTQREVLDELTRRQGWEAGNIDYLGADSFDNIWAKISQTLSKPRTSPPKQPSPPKEVPVEVAQEASAVDAALAAAVETSLEISGGEPIAIKTPEAPVEATPAVETNVAGDVAPGSIEAAPAGAEPVSPASVESSPAPVEVSSAPVEVASAPVESEKGSVQADPASAVSATVEAATVPVETGTVSVEAASAPTEPASVEIAPVPVEATSTPVEVVPVEAAPAAAPIEPSTEKPVQVEISKAAEATLTTETPAAIETKLPEAKTTEATAPVKVPTAVEAATASIPAAVPAAEIPATVEAVISVPQVESEIPATVGVCAPGEAPVPVEAKSETPEATAKSEPTLPLIQPASPKSSEEPVQSALPVQPVEVAKETVPVVPEPSLACPVSPKAMQPAATPEKSSEVPVGSDSPPLANTPSKDEVPKLPAAKSTEEAAQETRL